MFFEIRNREACKKLVSHFTLLHAEDCHIMPGKSFLSGQHIFLFSAGVVDAIKFI